VDPARARATRDPREQLLLRYVQAPMTIDFAGLLARRADPVALEVVLQHLQDAPVETRDAIIAARGVVPLTEGVPGADRDLLRAAVAARVDGAQPLPAGGAVTGLPRAGVPYDLRDVMLGGEPAGGTVPIDVARERLAQLDADLATRVTRADSRCLAVLAIARWVPPADADARFASLLAPVLVGDEVRLSQEASCRISAAFAIAGVAPARRTAVLVRLLDGRGVQPYDWSGMDSDPAVAVITDPRTVAGLAAAVIGRHPSWLDGDAELTAAVLAIAARPAADELDFELRLAIEPAVERVAAQLPADAAAAVERPWIADARRIAVCCEASSIYPTDLVDRYLLALAELAPRSHLVDDLRALAADLIAGPAVPGAIYTHSGVVRAAKIALATVDAPAPP
jgi:hypothetical protein